MAHAKVVQFSHYFRAQYSNAFCMLPCLVQKIFCNNTCSTLLINPVLCDAHLQWNVSTILENIAVTRCVSRMNGNLMGDTGITEDGRVA